MSSSSNSTINQDICYWHWTNDGQYSWKLAIIEKFLLNFAKYFVKFEIFREKFLGKSLVCQIIPGKIFNLFEFFRQVQHWMAEIDLQTQYANVLWCQFLRPWCNKAWANFVLRVDAIKDISLSARQIWDQGTCNLNNIGRQRSSEPKNIGKQILTCIIYPSRKSR